MEQTTQPLPEAITPKTCGLTFACMCHYHAFFATSCDTTLVFPQSFAYVKQDLVPAARMKSMMFLCLWGGCKTHTHAGAQIRKSGISAWNCAMCESKPFLPRTDTALNPRNLLAAGDSALYYPDITKWMKDFFIFS